MTLFRPEVMQHRPNRLHGDVMVALPTSWHVIGYLLFAALAAAILFLSFATYARVTTVNGTVVTDKGVAAISSTRAGVVTGIKVAEGSDVRAGDELLAVRTEEDLAAGATGGEQVAAQLRAQDAGLAAQADASRVSERAQLDQIGAQRSGILAETGMLENQIAIQSELVATAKADYDRTQAIAERGFISKRDLQTRAEALLIRRQQLSQLQQTLATRRSALAETSRQLNQVAAQADVQAATVQSARAQVSQQAASTGASRAYVLRAPTPGRVTALSARIGQSVAAQQSLLMIVPARAKLRVELYVPTTAIGFVEPGQEVRLAVDAFPYQRFGTVEGRIIDVAGAPVGHAGADGAVVPVYLITVQLIEDEVAAFGKMHALLPGMTLTARVLTARQTLIEWLFEPLFAVHKR